MEPAFYFLYLAGIAFFGAYLIVSGIKKKNLSHLLGLACLLLGFGDAFHLIPRAIGLFTDTLDAPSQTLALWLGVGKLITSVTMSVFYVILYVYFRKKGVFPKSKTLDIAVVSLTVARLTLLAFPQNGWVENASPLDWGIYRNIPFLALGILVIVLCFLRLRKSPPYRLLWLLIILSFLFYLPVVLFASMASWVGMLMIPKTICYLIIAYLFCRDAKNV